MSLSRLKSADDKTKYVVFGYSRTKMNELAVEIPMMIQYLFLMYYWIEEKFTIHGKQLQIDSSNKNHIIGNNKTDYSHSYNTVYGNNVIDMNDTSIIEYKWTFEYSNIAPFGTYFGIDSSNNKWINDCIHRDRGNSNEKYYSICINGKIYNYDLEWWLNSHGYDEEGILHLKLNMKDKSLFFKMDNNKAWMSINTDVDFEDNKFNMAVSVPKWSASNQSVKLISFDMTHP